MQGNKHGTDAWYWLRSPGILPDTTNAKERRVATYNMLGARGSDDVTREDGGVRPALPEEPRQGIAPGRNAR